LLIPIAIPLLGEAEADAARRPLLSGWVSQGPEVEAFEREFAAHVGDQTSAPHACAVSNCTTALHLALVALGVGPGDEVITASHSFIATANVIMQVGATPVFVDIEEDGHNIDPLLVEDAVTPRTRAILCVHQMGMPCDLGRLRRIADRHGLALVEDAACAAGSEIRLVGGGWPRKWTGNGGVSETPSAISCASHSTRARSSRQAKAGC
jgi:perosamine synthetase